MFRLYYLASKLDDKGHFNFLKFYIIVHYIDSIKAIGNALDLETGYFKHKYVDIIKTLFKITNKKAR